MAVSKADLTERKRGKGGTLVRTTTDLTRGVVYPAGVYVVKDLMTRKNYNMPDRIGIGPLDRGIAFGVSLDEIELA